MTCTTCGAPLEKTGTKLTNVKHAHGHCVAWLLFQLIKKEKK